MHLLDLHCNFACQFLRCREFENIVFSSLIVILPVCVWVVSIFGQSATHRKVSQCLNSPYTISLMTKVCSTIVFNSYKDCLHKYLCCKKTKITRHTNSWSLGMRTSFFVQGKLLRCRFYFLHNKSLLGPIFLRSQVCVSWH